MIRSQLRFFTFKNIGKEYEHDVGDFMTEYMEHVTEGKAEFNYETEEAIFQKTFAILARTLGEYSFGWMGKSGVPVARFCLPFRGIYARTTAGY